MMSANVHSFDTVPFRQRADPINDIYVTNVGSSTVYYGSSDTVSAFVNDGSIAAGESVARTDDTWFVATGTARVLIQVGTGFVSADPSDQGRTIDAYTGLPIDAGDAGSGSVMSFGAVGDGVTDDTLAVQAALDACRDAGGGTVVFPAGTYLMSATLTRHPSVSLRGETGRSRLEWATDLGAGESAMVCDGAVLPAPETRRIEGLWFRGPTVPAIDGTNAGMQGPQTQPFDLWVNCRSERFFSGFSVIEHHETFIGCVAISNRYGVYFSADGSANTFDQTFIATVLTGNTLASVGVAAGELIGTSLWMNTHFGFSPYCIHKETTTTDEYISELSTFTACTFEAYGNGIVYDESLRNGLTNTVFVNCTDSVPFDATYKAASRAANWAVDVGDILNCEFLHAAYNFLVWPGALGIIHCRSMAETQWADMRIAIDRCVSGGKLLVQATSAAVESGGRAKDRKVQFRPANAAITVGQLVFRVDSGYASVVSGVIPLGVAATPASAFGDTIAVYTSGIVPVNASGTVTASAAVKPSGSLDGMVVESTGWSDGPIVGAAMTAVVGGQISCDLFAP